MIPNIFLWYGIVTYVILGGLAYYHNNWSNNWDSSELTAFMLAPIVVPMVILDYTLKTLIKLINLVPRSSYPAPGYLPFILVAYMISWILFISLLNWLFS